MSKDIWNTADTKPEPFKTFVFKTDKGNTATSMLSENSGWNPILLPEFYSMDDFDKAERITKWCYLDDLLALETELKHTRKSLDVAWDGLEKIGSGNIIEHSVVGHEDDNKIFIANKALDESKTALEQKDVK